MADGEPHGRLLVMRPLLASLALAAIALTACGGDSGSNGDGPPVSLSPAGQAGYELYRGAGCAACHGAEGEGGVGPRLAGLYGTNEELQGGQIVLVDDEYLTRSIKDPNADKVAGYNIPMSQNNLSDAEVESVVAFIRELGDQSSVPGL